MSESNLVPHLSRLQDLANEGKTYQQMSDLLREEEGVQTSETSVRRAFRTHRLTKPPRPKRERKRPEPQTAIQRAARALEGEQTEEDRLLEKVDFYKSELKTAQNVIKRYRDRQGVEERIVRAINYALENSEYDQPLGRPVPRDIDPSARAHEFVLMMSDAHYGEWVNPDQAFGIEYNPDIGRRRIQHMRDVTFRYAELREKAYDVQKITVAVLGDMISGVIHEELEVNNEIVMADQVTEMAYLLFNFITDMASVFDAVDMVIIPGNHPRMEKKPRHKGKFNNFEFIMGKMVEGMVNASSDDREDVRVIVPRDLVYVHDVFDRRIGMMHGDGVKSNSFAGIPFYGLRNQREAVQALMSQVGESRIDMFMMGHWHQHLYWQGECDILINGSIKGGDEYGISTRLSAPDPVQVLTEWHPEHGLVGQSHITLTGIR